MLLFFCYISSYIYRVNVNYLVANFTRNYMCHRFVNSSQQHNLVRKEAFRAVSCRSTIITLSNNHVVIPHIVNKPYTSNRKATLQVLLLMCNRRGQLNTGFVSQALYQVEIIQCSFFFNTVLRHVVFLLSI